MYNLYERAYTPEKTMSETIEDAVSEASFSVKYFKKIKKRQKHFNIDILTYVYKPNSNGSKKIIKSFYNFVFKRINKIMIEKGGGSPFQAKT